MELTISKTFTPIRSIPSPESAVPLNPRVEYASVPLEINVLHPEDWQGEFLAPPVCGKGGRGYHSAVFPAQNAADLWVEIDLEEEQAFDRIVVFPCHYPGMGENDGKGFGFPRRFRIETKGPGTNAQWHLLHETLEDIPPPGLDPFDIKLQKPVTGRYLRLTTTKPWTTATDDGMALLALDELEIYKGNTNLALGKPATCANTLTAAVQVGTYDWHIDCLTDGVIHVNEPRHDQGQGNLCRRTFLLNQPIVRARAYIACRGWYELRLNGRKAGDAVLDSAWTVFDKRLLYSTWNVAELLQTGENVVTVLVGNGWSLNPAFILQLNIEHPDGSKTTVFSDDQWKLLRSPVCENSVFHGETYDARLANPAVFTPKFKDAQFPAVPILHDYNPVLSEQMNPPIRVTGTRSPIAWNEPEPGVWVADLGQNIAGFARLRIRAEAGHEIKLRFAETIFDDGSVWTDAEQTKARQEGRLNVTDGMLNTANNRSARATDRYICRGTGEEETWEPEFTYHGFRFVEITGLPAPPSKNTLTGCIAHTDVRSIGHFQCSNELFNWAQTAVRRTLLNNLHSVPTDCCQRDERQGWMADAHVACETMLYNFNAASTYSKWLQDMRDTQRQDGAIGDTTPYTLGRMGGDIGWGSAIILVAWYVYLHTGDRGRLETHYPAMRKYMFFLEHTYPQRIVDNATYGGDWLGVEETPHQLTNTGFFLHCAKLMVRCAKTLGETHDTQRFRTLADEITTLFHNRFFDPKTGHYGNGSQFSNLFPLYLEVVPKNLQETVLDQLVDNIEQRNRHLSTGFLGTRYLLEVLCDHGRDDLAYAIATTEDYPGWGYMRKHQATTLWEHWGLKTGNDMNSHDHPCFCSIGGWFVKYLAGIRPNPDDPGYRNILIAPVFPAGLEHVTARLQTVRGTVVSTWQRQGENITLHIDTPPECVVELQLPHNASEVHLNDTTLWQKSSNSDSLDKNPIPLTGKNHTADLTINLG